MLIGSMGGLGKRGKKKMVQKRAESCRNLTKVIKKRALSLQKVAEI
jgi:hypothetical protein